MTLTEPAALATPVDTHQSGRLRSGRNLLPQLPSDLDGGVWLEHYAYPLLSLHNVKFQTPAIFISGPWCLKVQLNLLFKMVRLVSKESGWRVGTYSHEIGAFQLDSSQIEPCFDVTILYSWS